LTSLNPASPGELVERVPQVGTAPKIKHRSSYLPTLDGWRAIAILVVMLDHAPTLHIGRWSTGRFHELGGFGVDIFFAISGLLICSRLLDEEETTGGLQIKGFYVRRIFRIQPAALFYLGVVLLLTLFHRLPVYGVGLITSLFLVRNYFGMNNTTAPAVGWVTAHYWSLSVEEHFYLILPSLLRFTRRWRAQILLGLAVAGFAWRMSLGNQVTSDFFSIRVRTEDCICFLFLSAGAAVLLRREGFRQLAVRYIRSFAVLPLAVIMLWFHRPLRSVVEIIPVFMVMSTMLHPEELAAKLLEWAPLRFVGRISYSLYLWQQIFLSCSWAPTIRPFGWLNCSALVWPCSFAAAIGSYYLIEKPFIRLGHRFAPPTTSGRPI